jgi:cytosine/adenosine deaminase-related metal-dependent hydrolase
MEELGCTVWLGTDNVMFVQPDMLSEMAFVSAVYGLEPSSILRAAVGGSVLGGSPFFIRKGVKANLFCVNPAGSNLRFSRDPLVSLTKRANPAVIGTNVFNL